MSRKYTVVFNAVAVTAQQDFFEIVAASGKPCRVLGLMLSQSTEVGDSAEEGLNITIKSGQTTSGSGGSSYTPVPLNTTDAAAGFTAEINNTTKASTGTIVTHVADNWNVRLPYVLIFTPEMQVEVIGGRRLTVELGTTPADSITISGTLFVEELG